MAGETEVQLTDISVTFSVTYGFIPFAPSNNNVFNFKKQSKVKVHLRKADNSLFNTSNLLLMKDVPCNGGDTEVSLRTDRVVGQLGFLCSFEVQFATLSMFHITQRPMIGRLVNNELEILGSVHYLIDLLFRNLSRKNDEDHENSQDDRYSDVYRI
jgi:hypothetical protein